VVLMPEPALAPTVAGRTRWATRIGATLAVLLTLNGCDGGKRAPGVSTS